MSVVGGILLFIFRRLSSRIGAASMEPEFPNLSAYGTNVLTNDLDTDEQTTLGTVQWYRLQDLESGDEVFGVFDAMDGDAAVVAETLATTLAPEVQEALPLLDSLFYVRANLVGPGLAREGVGRRGLGSAGEEGVPARVRRRGVGPVPGRGPGAPARRCRVEDRPGEA